MTISTTNVRNDYVGNGAAVTYPYTFKAFTAADLLVYVDGVLQTITTHYSVTGVGANAGGNVVFVTAPADDTPIAIVASMTLTQTTDLVNESRFFQSRIEDRMDKLCRADQINAEGISRSLRLPAEEVGASVNTTLPSKAERASKFSGWDADGNPIAVASGPATLDTLTYHVGQYGAVGDGVTDDTAAVQAAIAAAPSGATIRFDGSKHYYLTSLGTIAKPLTIDGGGCRITCDITPTDTLGTPLFSFCGSISSSYNLTGAVATDATSVTLATIGDAASFSVGDFVRTLNDDVVNLWDDSGPANVGLVDLNRIAAVNLSTGELTLQYPVSNGYSVNPRIGKVAMIDGPCVKNMRVSEVDPGAIYIGAVASGPTAPNIVDLFACINFRVENVAVYGWNVIAFSAQYCVNGVFAKCVGEGAFHPSSGGQSVVHKLWFSRNIGIDGGYGKDCRHLVDWHQCMDSWSRQCICTTDDPTIMVETTAYLTHGARSRRISSYGDTAINCNGWSAGSYVYSYDGDILIRDFKHSCSVGNNTGISVWGGAYNVTIETPQINTIYNGVRINRGARNVVIRGGRILAGDGRAAVYCTFEESQYPSNISIDGVVAQSSGTGIVLNIDATGDIAISDCTVTGGVCARLCDTTGCTNLVFSRNILNTDGARSAAATIGASGQVPSGMFSVVGNTVSGTSSGDSIFMTATNSLECRNNRSLDQAGCIALGTLTSHGVALAGGIVRWNNDTTDSHSVVQNLHLLLPDSTSGGVYFRRVEVARWRWAMDNTAESGSDAGSRMELQAWDDAGAFIDYPITVDRAATGSIGLNRRTVLLGESSLAAILSVEMRAAAGQHRHLSWKSGNLDRWVARANNTAEGGSNAGSDWQLIAYDDAGAQIDIPIAITRAANNDVALNRPLKTNFGRKKKKTAIVSAASTTAISGNDHFVVVTGSTTHTLTLPAASDGKEVQIKNRSTGTVTVNRAGSDTIDGGTTFNLTAGQGTTLIANSTDWCRVANA